MQQDRLQGKGAVGGGGGGGRQEKPPGPGLHRGLPPEAPWAAQRPRTSRQLWNWSPGRPMAMSMDWFICCSQAQRTPSR